MNRTFTKAAILAGLIVGCLVYAHHDRSKPDTAGEYPVAKAGGPDTLLIDGHFSASSENDIEVVGDCAKDKKVTLRADGWYELKLNGTVPVDRECHVTLRGFNNGSAAVYDGFRITRRVARDPGSDPQPGSDLPNVAP